MTLPESNDQLLRDITVAERRAIDAGNAKRRADETLLRLLGEADRRNVPTTSVDVALRRGYDLAYRHNPPAD